MGFMMTWDGQLTKTLNDVGECCEALAYEDVYEYTGVYEYEYEDVYEYKYVDERCGDERDFPLSFQREPICRVWNEPFKNKTNSPWEFESFPKQTNIWNPFKYGNGSCGLYSHISQIFLSLQSRKKEREKEKKEKKERKKEEE